MYVYQLIAENNSVSVAITAADILSEKTDWVVVDSMSISEAETTTKKLGGGLMF